MVVAINSLFPCLWIAIRIVTGRSAFRFLTNFLLIESNKKMEAVDKSSVLFNVGERDARESTQLQRRNALKQKVLADAEDESDDAPTPK